MLLVFESEAASIIASPLQERAGCPYHHLPSAKVTGSAILWSLCVGSSHSENGVLRTVELANPKHFLNRRARCSPLHEVSEGDALQSSRSKHLVRWPR